MTELFESVERVPLACILLVIVTVQSAIANTTLPDETAGASTDFGLIGNFSYWKIAMGEQMSTEDLREGSIPDADTGEMINLTTQDLRALKMRAFHDMGTNFEQAFAKFTTAAS